MPIREYKCETCGVETEKLEKVNGSPEVYKTYLCDCGGTQVRMLSAPSVFILKGGGFYGKTRH